MKSPSRVRWACRHCPYSGFCAYWDIRHLLGSCFRPLRLSQRGPAFRITSLWIRLRCADKPGCVLSNGDHADGARVELVRSSIKTRERRARQQYQNHLCADEFQSFGVGMWGGLFWDYQTGRRRLPMVTLALVVLRPVLVFKPVFTLPCGFRL